MADVFAPAECLLDVKTQVGLYLTGTADDRAHHYDEGNGYRYQLHRHGNTGICEGRWQCRYRRIYRSVRTVKCRNLDTG